MSADSKKIFSFELEKVTTGDFKYFSELVFQLAGIHLLPNEKNFSLVQNRLLKLIRKYNLADYSELASFLKKEIHFTVQHTLVIRFVNSLKIVFFSHVS